MTVSRREFSTYLLASFAAMAVPGVSVNTALADANAPGLARRYRDAFLMGTMVDEKYLFDPDPGARELVEHEFNALTSDNIFKWENIHPLDDVWNWSHADRFVDYALQKDMYPIGHPVIWDVQVPDGLFSPRRTNPRSSQQIVELMHRHVETLMSRYRGAVMAWDVVNEAFDDNGQWIKNSWYHHMGEGYIEKAFSAARSADPSATLIYNDYNLWQPRKRQKITSLIQQINATEKRVDAIGMQGHIGLDYPDLNEFEKSLEAYAEMGLRVHITELDIDVLPRPAGDIDNVSSTLDPYRDGLPDDVAQALAYRYEALFRVLLKHRNVIDRVTFWGYSDRYTWRNDFPLPGRTNHPLLFDRAFNPKAAYRSIYNIID